MYLCCFYTFFTLLRQVWRSGRGSGDGRHGGAAEGAGRGKPRQNGPGAAGLGSCALRPGAAQQAGCGPGSKAGAAGRAENPPAPAAPNPSMTGGCPNRQPPGIDRPARSAPAAAAARLFHRALRPGAYSWARIASPMAAQPTRVQPSLIMSPVRRPASSTAFTARSMASASAGASKL